MKNSKLRKVLLLACSAVLLVCLSVGATIAYLTDTKTVTNTFTVGKVAITLDEAAIKEDEETGDWIKDSTKPRVDENEYHLMPGLSYYKDPTVTVQEKSEPSYVKMTVQISKSEELDDIFDAHSDYVITDIVKGYDDTEWACVDVSTSSAVVNDKTETYRTYEFWYLAGGAEPAVVDARDAAVTLPALFTSIDMPGSITNDELASIDGMKIVVNAYAIQAAGFANAAEAWEAFETK